MNGKAMLLAAGVMAAANPVHAAGKALIIGIDRYAEPALSLIGSVNDAQNMRDFAIGRWGFAPTDVKLLLDGEATRAAILDALDRWLVDGTRPGDTVLFYFSGHGHHVPDLDGDERADNPGDDRDEVLVAHDGRLFADGRYEGFVIDDEIAARLKKLKDRQVVMLIDSCHSGTMTRSIGSGSGGVAKTPNFGAAAGVASGQGGGASRSVSDAVFRGHQRIQPDMTDGAGNVVAFYAAGSTQLAQVNERVRPMQGVFTEAFLRGAAGAADANRNGVVSLAEIESFVRTEAHAYCSQNACKTGMTPFVEAPAAMMHKDLITFAQAPTLPQAAVDAVGPGSAGEPVKVTVGPAGPALRVGQTYDVTVTSPIDGTLVVIDLPPDNDVKLVFPNQWSVKAGVSHKVKAGQTIRFPDRYHGFSIKATPPAGRGSVLALAIQDDIPFDRLQRLIKDAANPAVTRGGLVTVPDPLSFLGELGKALVIPWTGELTTRGVKWAMGHYDYEIVK